MGKRKTKDPELRDDALDYPDVPRHSGLSAEYHESTCPPALREAKERRRALLAAELKAAE